MVTRVRAATALALIACALGLVACGGAAVTFPRAPSLEGAPIPPTPAPDFSLRDQHGRPVTLASLRGQIVLLSFLGTHCGSTCDVIAQQIRGALDEVHGGGAKVLIVSAERGDTPASISAFLARNGLAGRALFLTGGRAELRRLYSAYRVHPPESSGRRFSEYAFVLVIDREGRERAIFETPELTPEALAKDIRRLGG